MSRGAVLRVGGPGRDNVPRTRAALSLPLRTESAMKRTLVPIWRPPIKFIPACKQTASRNVRVSWLKTSGLCSPKWRCPSHSTVRAYALRRSKGLGLRRPNWADWSSSSDLFEPSKQFNLSVEVVDSPHGVEHRVIRAECPPAIGVRGPGLRIVFVKA